MKTRIAIGSHLALLLSLIIQPIGAAENAGQASASAASSFESDRKQEEASCRQNMTIAPWVDCACAGRQFATERRAGGGPGRADFELEQKAFTACPAASKQPIVTGIFNTCDSYYSKIRSDHTEFCTCVGNRVADNYMAKPDLLGTYREQLRRKAMEACGAADTSHRIDDRSVPGAHPTPHVQASSQASASCVQFVNNEKGIAAHAKMGHQTGDIIVVNKCPANIVVVQTAADAFQVDGPSDQCIAEAIEPNGQKVMRSMSPRQTPGLVRFVPRVAAIICAGPAANGMAEGAQETPCGCAPGVPQITLPDPTNL